MGIRYTFRREIDRMVSRKLYLVSTIILPIIAILFFAYLFSGSVPRNLPIAVCDQDQSGLSSKLIRMIESTPSIAVTQRVNSIEEGERLIRMGSVYGLVCISKNFQNEIYRGQSPNVLSYYNNVYMIAGGLINKDLTMVMKTFSKGLDYNKRVKKGASVTSAQVAVNPISIDTHVLFNPYSNYFYYLASTFLPIMLIMFTLLSTVYAIGIELKDSTSKEWLASSGNQVWKALIGKLLPYFIIFSLLGIFINSLLFQYFGAPQNGNLALVTYNTILLVLTYMACGIFIISIFPSLRMALSVASLFSAMAFTFSGLTFPFIAMYDWTIFLGQFFPFTHYLRIFIDQTMRGAPIYYSFWALIGIHTFLVLPFISNRKLKKVCLDKKYWGKS